MCLAGTSAITASCAAGSGLAVLLSRELRCDEGYIAKLPMIQIDPRLTAVTQHLAQKTLDDFQQLLKTMKPQQAVA